MGKWANDAGLDAGLAWYADCNVLHVCSAQPANYAGIAAVSLGSVALTPGAGNGDFTLADGDTSGRKLTIAAQDIAAATASNAGATLHVVLAKTTDTTLRYVTPTTSQPVTAGNPISIAAWRIQLQDPA